ncbi:MAG: hypothetical protein ACYCYF_07145 [Anaerolineae bacterium]
MVLAAVRDVAIVLLALASLVIGVMLVLLLLQIRSLVRTLREEVTPILQATQDTANRVGGTVHLVSDTVVSPLIKVSSYAAGVRRAVDALRGIRGSAARRSPGKHDSSATTGSV